MAKPKLKLAAAVKRADPTLQTSELLIDGKTYTLCLDFGALMDAEEDLIAAGHDVSLMLSLRPDSASALRTFLTIAIRRFHPEVSYEDARKLMTPANAMLVSNAVVELWQNSMPKPKAGDKATADPIQP